MIPRLMQELLHEVVAPKKLEQRLIADGSKRYLELRSIDVETLHALGITVDQLGPRMVACMWDEESPEELGGYLVVDNLAMGRPSMGGIRMLGDITPAVVHNLARGMTLKNAAANLPYGGGKSGIVADGRLLTPEQKDAVVRGFGLLLARYADIYNPGPDVGTADADMKTIAIENGLDNVVSKPVDMGGNRIDQLGGAARGCVLSIREMRKHLERLRSLPQFRDLPTPRGSELTVLIQGFGAVGAHTARLLREEFPGDPPAVVGVSDRRGYLYARRGLPTDRLFQMWDEGVDRDRLVTLPYLKEWVSKGVFDPPLTFSMSSDELLRESAFCLVPAAPVANYLGLDEEGSPSITVDRMGPFRMVVEGANTYSPDPERKAARSRLERVVYRDRGVLIVTDYLVNSGGVIYAAHERLIPTPAHLAIPAERLGDRAAVDAWLADHAEEFAELAERRREAAKERLEAVIESNMRELVDRLVADPHCLPCEAAEQISVSRIASQERFRTARDVMGEISTIAPDATMAEVAKRLVDGPSEIIAVVSGEQRLVGVITDRDLTRSVAVEQCAELSAGEIMTREVIAVPPEAKIIDCVAMLETNEISAMPVIEGDRVVGMVSGDLLARRTLLRLLQTQERGMPPAGRDSRTPPGVA